MGDHLNVDPTTLQDAASGINAVVGELKGLGIDATGAEGRGFSELELSGTTIGHPDIKSAFDTFCDRWTWGVRSLVQDANAIAQALDLSAGKYYDEDQYNQNVLKRLVTDGMGNPHLTDDQADQRSWGDTFGDNPFTQTKNADYSAESWDKAGESMKETGSALVEEEINTAKDRASFIVPDGDR